MWLSWSYGTIIFTAPDFEITGRGVPDGALRRSLWSSCHKLRRLRSGEELSGVLNAQRRLTEGMSDDWMSRAETPDVRIWSVSCFYFEVPVSFPVSLLFLPFACLFRSWLFPATPWLFPPVSRLPSVFSLCLAALSVSVCFCSCPVLVPVPTWYL